MSKKKADEIMLLIALIALPALLSFEFGWRVGFAALAYVVIIKA